MNLEKTLQRIRYLMSLFVTEIKAATAMQQTDINKVSENVVIPLFAQIYGYKNLKNLNFSEGSNFPSIDLGDETARVAFQITSTPIIKKVQETLKKFIEYKLYEKYDRLIIYILTEKQKTYSDKEINKIIQGKFKFDTKKDIWDSRNILEKVSGFEIEQAREVEKILEANFGEIRRQPEWEVIDKVEQIINEYTQLFVGRSKETQELDNFLYENSSGAMLVTAEAGFGKTALLANWLQSRQNNNCFIAYHFFSEREEKTRSAKSAYKNLLRQLHIYYELYNEPQPNELDELRAAIYNILRERGAREDKLLIIVVDALGELNEVEIPFSLPFPTPLPDNVFVIASARASEAEEPKYLENWIEQSQKLHLKRLPKFALTDWLKRTGEGELALFADDTNFVDQLDEMTQGFPLYLSYLTDELNHAAKQQQDVHSVLAETPQGFEKYVKQQLKRLDELELPDERWQFFALLAVAKGVLEKDDIKVITQMRDRQLRQLHQCWQVTRWMKISGGKDYAFAHPLLGTMFAKELGDDAEEPLQKLIDFCSQWQKHQSCYALRHYPEHLRDGEQWDNLYGLLHNFEFIEAKVNHIEIGVEALIKDYVLIETGELSNFSDEKKQTIKTLQLIQGALRLSAHVSIKDTKQLATQLLGRLLNFNMPEVQVLLEQILQTKIAWLRPLTASLISPSEPSIRTLSGHSSSVWSVAVTSDGQKLISGSQDGAVKIWNLKSGNLIRTITAHNDSVNTVITSHDGLYIFSGSHDKSIKIWDLNTGDLIRTLTGHHGSINAVVLTPDGSKIISASSDCSLKVWNLKNGEVLHKFIGHKASVQALAIINTDNKNLVISGSYNDTPRVWNLETGKEEFSLGESDMVWSTTAIPNKELVIFGSQDGTFTIWNLKTREKEYSFKGHSNSVRAISVTSDGERIISVSEDKTLKIWKVGTWENEATINAHTGSVLAVAVTSDGTKIISASGSTIYNLLSNDYTIKIWNLERCVQHKFFDTENSKTPHSDSVEVIYFTPDGKQVRSASKDGTLKFWKVETWENEKTLTGNVNLAFTFGDKQNQKIIKLKFGDIEETFHSIRSTLPFILATTSDNNLQILSSGDEKIKVWDASLGKDIATFTGESEIRCCAIAPDGQTLAVGEASGRLHFLRLCLRKFE
ncbi:SMEK domain-containing protein [Rivularia sp. UHCC 0363]|uniref:SMEK domain-containing protein n=1 Tax=Rivularia sp. UHCC 0363 TaxID=3110244 RepID=UPI002B1ECB31|nr:SMEK domain-containing protein [Rivularia sp. UHCC 0363]MEA5594244.1 SMEK domain-containing protein [Rivularia sp. UHCC 0363]